MLLCHINILHLYHVLCVSIIYQSSIHVLLHFILCTMLHNTDVCRGKSVWKFVLKLTKKLWMSDCQPVVATNGAISWLCHHQFSAYLNKASAIKKNTCAHTAMLSVQMVCFIPVGWPALERVGGGLACLGLSVILGATRVWHQRGVSGCWDRGTYDAVVLFTSCKIMLNRNSYMWNADKNPGAVGEEREKMDNFLASLEVSSMNGMA